MAERNFQAALPIPFSSRISLDLLMSIFLLSIYLAIQHKDFLIFLELKGKYSSELWREIDWKVPFYNSSSIGWLELYSSWILIISSDWLVLESLLFVLLPCGLKYMTVGNCWQVLWTSCLGGYCWFRFSYDIE